MAVANYHNREIIMILKKDSTQIIDNCVLNNM